MLYQIIYGSGSFLDKLLNFILIAVTVLISLTVHEIAHGWVAYKMGDPTARNLGRLSLDPRKHLDPVGTLMMLFVGVGFAKPVPINSRYFKKPKLGMALTAAAGPIANFLMAFFGAGFYLLFFKLGVMSLISGGSGFIIRFLTIMRSFFLSFCWLNISLGFFNLIPVPPFDGSRILFIFLPEKLYFGIMKYERYIMLAILLLLVTGARFSFISTIAGFFTERFVSFWSLIPWFNDSSPYAIFEVASMWR